jgi:RNase P/RNase MRP subunit p29
MQKKKTVKVPLIGEIVQVKLLNELKKFNGTIIDETKNTIKIQINNSVKTLIKNQIEITLNQEKILSQKTIKGQELVGRVEERLKK